MPIVTIDPHATERFVLKTAPANPDVPGDEDGFILARPLPYGMKLTRRDKATRMMMKSSPTQSRKTQQDSTIELETQTEWAVAFDFSHCIVDHNLTDQSGRKLDFTKVMDLKLLDPKVGSEIEKCINSLNEDEDEESLEDLVKRSSLSSMDEPTELLENGTNQLGTKKDTLSEVPTENL